jgi:hypothetical protein
MNTNRDHLEIAYHSVNAFGNDGKLDEYELGKLLNIAERDGVVNEDETRILSNIFSKLKSYEISSQMREKVRNVEQKYGIKII